MCVRALHEVTSSPLQGANGCVQFSKGYLKRAYELVRERGGLCIADEVGKNICQTDSPSVIPSESMV